MLSTKDCQHPKWFAHEKVYPEIGVWKLKARIAELKRVLGRKTVDNEILNYAVEVAVEKKRLSPVHLAKLRGGR